MHAPADIARAGQLVIATREGRLVCVAVSAPDDQRRPIVSWAGAPDWRRRK